MVFGKNEIIKEWLKNKASEDVFSLLQEHRW